MAKKNRQSNGEFGLRNGTKNKSAGRRVGERAGVVSKSPTPRMQIPDDVASKHPFVPDSKTGGFEKDSEGKYIYRLPDFVIYSDSPRSRAELNRASGVKQRPRKFQNRTQLSAKSKRRKIRN